MNRNPYAPPEAAVVVEERPAREKPLAIRRAVILMWASFALNMLILAVDWKFQVSRASLMVLVISQAIGIAISIWLILMITAGRNWARIVYLVLLILGSLVIVPEIMSTVDRAAHVAGLRMIELGMDIGTLYLIFIPGREWFRNPGKNG